MKIIKVSKCNSPNNFDCKNNFISYESLNRVNKNLKNCLHMKSKNKILKENINNTCKNDNLKSVFKIEKNEKKQFDNVCYECGIKACIKGYKVYIIDKKSNNKSDIKNFKKYGSPKNKNFLKKLDFIKLNKKLNKRDTHKKSPNSKFIWGKNKIDEIINYRIWSNNILSELNNKKFKIKIKTNKNLGNINKYFTELIDYLIITKENLLNGINKNNNLIIKNIETDIKNIQNQINISDLTLDYINKYSNFNEKNYSSFLNKINIAEDIQNKEINFHKLKIKDNFQNIYYKFENFVSNNILNLYEKSNINFNFENLKEKINKIKDITNINLEENINMTYNKNPIKYNSNKIVSNEISRSNNENLDFLKIKKHFSDFSSNIDININEGDKTYENLENNKIDKSKNDESLVGYFTKKINNSKSKITIEKENIINDDLGCNEQLPSISEFLK